jgi:hypothetical protein
MENRNTGRQVGLRRWRNISSSISIQAEQVKLKFLNPLVSVRISPANTLNALKTSADLEEDIRLLQNVERQQVVYKEDMEKDFKLQNVRP